MARRIILGGSIAVLLLAGCGGQEPNRSRVPSPVQTTVKVTDAVIVVSPDTFDVKTPAGITQEPSAPAAAAAQQGQTLSTQTQTEPPTSANQPVELTIINLSNQHFNLEVTGPGVDALSHEVPAGGTGLLKVSLGTGTYKVSARGDFRPKPGKLKIGPLRQSAQGYLLLP